MTTILPNQIPNMTVPLLGADGKLNQTWWLFFYNISRLVLGTDGYSAAATAAQLNADLDADADTSDLLGLVGRLANVQKTQEDAPVTPSLQSVTQALLMAQDGLLPDPAPRGQPVSLITATGSPYTYTAPFDGSLLVTGASAVQVSRDGVTFYSVNDQFLSVSRSDQVRVTYSAAPTMAFFRR